jgi:cysteine desulfurase
VIYLDYQATTPTDPRVLEEMLPYFTDEFGNPSSAHAYGRRAAAAVLRAREQVARLIGARVTDEVVFTGSGTEATHLGVYGAALPLKAQKDHIVTTAVEHPGTAGACARLATQGFRITLVPVNGDGIVDPADIDAAITDRTALVTVIHGQNEIGTLQPVSEIAAITRRRGALLHVDAAQSLTAVPVDVARNGIDLLTIVGHKFYAPKGIGALYVRQGVAVAPQVTGGGQERGLRAATENVPGIVGLGAAAQLLMEQRDEDACRIRQLRDRLADRLAAGLPGLLVNGSRTQRIPGNLSVVLPGAPAHEVMAAVPDLAISAGSACHADSIEPSEVLLAIGRSIPEARCTLRIGIGRFTTAAEVDTAADQLIAAARGLRPGL